MANDYDDDEFEGDVPELRKAHRASTKRVKELEAEVASLRQQGRERTVKDVLAAKGVSNASKIAKLIPATVTDEDGVSGWLDEYADVFGIATNDGDAAGTGPDPAQVQALADINGASAGGGVPSTPEDLAARIQAAESVEDMQRIIAGG